MTYTYHTKQGDGIWKLVLITGTLWYGHDLSKFAEIGLILCTRHNVTGVVASVTHRQATDNAYGVIPD